MSKGLTDNQVKKMVNMFEHGYSFMDLRVKFKRSQNKINKYLSHHYGNIYQWKSSIHKKMVRKGIKKNTSDYRLLMKIARSVKPNKFYISKPGYVLVSAKNHPFCDCRGYYQQHRIVVEDRLGRYLSKKEIVHHINNIKHDNRNSNLAVMTNKGHSQYHGNGNAKNFTYKPGGSSIFRGVSMKVRSGTTSWVADIHVNSKPIRIGSFKTEIEAAVAYNNKCDELNVGERKNDIVD